MNLENSRARRAASRSSNGPGPLGPKNSSLTGPKISTSICESLGVNLSSCVGTSSNRFSSRMRVWMEPVQAKTWRPSWAEESPQRVRIRIYFWFLFCTKIVVLPSVAIGKHSQLLIANKPKNRLGDYRENVESLVKFLKKWLELDLFYTRMKFRTLLTYLFSISFSLLTINI